MGGKRGIVVGWLGDALDVSIMTHTSVKSKRNG